MKAALVTDFEQPPTYADVPEPTADPGRDEVVVDVLAVGLHPRVRSQAAGTHYTSDGILPLIPGVDGVVRAPDGSTRYAILDDTTNGTMAERTVVAEDRTVVLPDDIDPVTVAAAMNPAMSAWMALRARVDLPTGAAVAVLGATGSAGRLAIQIARRLGATQVVAVGRDRDRLAALVALGATELCTFDELAVAADVDVVLDYVWGEPTERGLVEVLTNRADRGRPLTWIEIGAVAGPDVRLPAAALRSARLSLVGSGIGSIPRRDFVAELPAVAAVVCEPGLDVRARAVPLGDVEQAWSTSASDERIVLVP